MVTTGANIKMTGTRNEPLRCSGVPDGVSTLSGRDGFVQRSELPLLVPGPGLRLSRAVLASNGGGELYVDTLKNKRARTVPLVPVVVPIVDRWERRQEPG